MQHVKCASIPYTQKVWTKNTHWIARDGCSWPQRKKSIGYSFPKWIILYSASVYKNVSGQWPVQRERNWGSQESFTSHLLSIYYFTCCLPFFLHSVFLSALTKWSLFLSSSCFLCDRYTDLIKQSFCCVRPWSYHQLYNVCVWSLCARYLVCNMM